MGHLNIRTVLRVQAHQVPGVDPPFYVLPDSPGVVGLIIQRRLPSAGFDDEGRPSSGGDIIIAVNDVLVSSGAEMTAQINRSQPGDEMTLTVFRDGQEERLMVVLGQWPGQ